MNISKTLSFKKYLDDRGSIKIFKKISSFDLKQINFTHSKKNVVRGMHFQKKNLISKIIFITSGEILDVLVNVNTKKIYYFTLNKDKPMLFIPKNYAHGFQVLSNKVEMLYLFDGPYQKKDNIGFNIFDEKINIKWKNPKKIILSQKDKLLGSFEDFLKYF